MNKYGELSKYHGCGNDFIIAEYKEGVDYNELAKKTCNRNAGIGADTFIMIKKTDMFEVYFYNVDGSQAPMCGNGIRCAAAYLYDNDLMKDDVYELRTLSGIRKVWRLDNEYLINMGTPDFRKETLSIEESITDNDELFNYTYNYEDEEYNLNAVFMTTHHLVIPVDSLEITDEVGDYFCTHPMFKKMINVNFVQIIDENTIKLRTYERGCGWTGACGSGSSSSVVVLNRKGLVNKEVKVLYKYGTLTIKLIENEVFMQGPAVRIANKINYFG